MLDPSSPDSTTYKWFLEEGHNPKASQSWRSKSVGKESVESLQIRLRQVSGGRKSPDDEVRQRLGGFPTDLDICEMYEAMNELIELGKENAHIVDEELVQWFAEVVRAYIEKQEARAEVEEVHIEAGVVEAPGTAPLESTEEDQVADASSIHSFDSIYSYFPRCRERDDPYMQAWVHDIFLRDWVAKKHGAVFAGGADELCSSFDIVYCPHCNKPVGEETDQHVVKCSFAHKELERLHWSMERTKGKSVLSLDFIRNMNHFEAS